MANAAKKRQPIKILLDQCQKSYVFYEVRGRDKAFANSEQCYHLTSTDAEAVAVRLLCHFTGRDVYRSYTPLSAYM